MSVMTEDRRPGDTDLHRRQRSKNLFMFFVLLALAAVFFGITIVKMGAQTGIKLQYRGGTMEVDLLPKLKLELYIQDGDVDSAMKTICDAGRTGKFGDGRIFVSHVEKSGKVRTGEVFT